MATEWKMIRVPASLANRLADLADDMMKAHMDGRSPLPGEYVEHVPLHHVIDRMAAEWSAHKARSRAPKRPRASV